MSKKHIKIEKTRPIPIPKPTIWQKNIPITELAKKTLLEKKTPKNPKNSTVPTEGDRPIRHVSSRLLQQNHMDCS
jgi:hypothetical protein